MFRKIFGKISKALKHLSNQNDSEPEVIYINAPKIEPRKKNITRPAETHTTYHHVPKKSPEEIESELIEQYSDFLKDLGSNTEQKRAVISESNRILLLAGAGSGKTKVLTKRVIHLVKNKKVSLDQIIALTFAKDAAKEMKDRVAKELGCNPEKLTNIRTIHSFCLNLLKQNEQFGVLNNSEQAGKIRKIISELSLDPNFIQLLTDYTSSGYDSQFNINANSSITHRDKFKFGEKKISTLKNGVFVRSKSERDIANFLTQLGVSWDYELPTNWSDGEFRPDFTIHTPQGDIFIEHWAYNDATPEISQINKTSYLEKRRWKEEQFKKHNRVLISIEENEMNDLIGMQARLKGNIEKELKTILAEKGPLDQLEKRKINQLVNDLVEIINIVKSKMMKPDDIEARLSSVKKNKVKQFYAILLPVMKKYQECLETEDWGKKDFNDLIEHTIKLLKENSERREYYHRKYTHILVDEFQDVSYGMIELLKLLVSKNTSLFAVGDDWQSIYGWRGSDVSYILNFSRDFGHTNEIILPINYRSPRNIVDASTHFIQGDKVHIKKDIRSSLENGKNIEKIIQVNAVDDTHAVNYIIKVIQDLTKNNGILPEQILILYRKGNIPVVGKLREFLAKNSLPVKLRTIHSVKGKEADIVFVLGLTGGPHGFPYIISNSDIKRVVNDTPLSERESEERRLFYVAMTRAKKKLFLIAENNNESEYLRQLPEDCVYVSVWNNLNGSETGGSEAYHSHPSH